LSHLRPRIRPLNRKTLALCQMATEQSTVGDKEPSVAKLKVFAWLFSLSHSIYFLFPQNVFFLLKIMKVPAPPPSTTSAPSYGPAIDIDLDIDLGTPDNPIDDINLGRVFFSPILDSKHNFKKVLLCVMLRQPSVR
jgi:hypothetical protein